MQNYSLLKEAKKGPCFEFGATVPANIKISKYQYFLGDIVQIYLC